MKAHRLFFSLACLQGAVAIALWAWFARPPLDHGLWHVHEMTLGYSLAVISGFLLTKDKPGILVTLALLWSLARIGYLVPEIVAPLSRGSVSLASTGLFSILAARTFLRGVKRLKNIVFPCVIGLFSIAELTFQLGEWNVWDQGTRFGAYLSLGFVLTLIVTMGGRIAAAAISGAWQKSGGERISNKLFGEQLIAACLLIGFIGLGMNTPAWTIALPLALSGFLLPIRIVPRLTRLDKRLLQNRKSLLFPMSLRLVALLQIVIGIGLALFALPLFWNGLNAGSSGALHLALIPGIGGTTLIMMIRTLAQRSGQAESKNSLLILFILMGIAALLRSGIDLFSHTLATWPDSTALFDLRSWTIFAAAVSWVVAMIWALRAVR